MEETKKISPKLKPNYVCNADLYQAYVKWNQDIDEAKLHGKDEPPIPNYIAESIMKICHRLSFRPNFINYSYREDMVGDALENCIKTAKNFNIAKSENPFSFITTIAFNAFLRRIEAEKKQSYVKGKLIEDLPLDELMNIQEHDDDIVNYHNQFIEFLRENNYTDTTTMSPAERKRNKKVQLHEEDNLESFMPKEE
jgi:DNA-directed RNA polymerase specialized sigma24 family protein